MNSEDTVLSEISQTQKTNTTALSLLEGARDYAHRQNVQCWFPEFGELVRQRSQRSQSLRKEKWYQSAPVLQWAPGLAAACSVCVWGGTARSRLRLLITRLAHLTWQATAQGTYIPHSMLCTASIYNFTLLRKRMWQLNEYSMLHLWYTIKFVFKQQIGLKTALSLTITAIPMINHHAQKLEIKLTAAKWDMTKMFAVLVLWFEFS